MFAFQEPSPSPCSWKNKNRISLWLGKGGKIFKCVFFFVRRFEDHRTDPKPNPSLYVQNVLRYYGVQKKAKKAGLRKYFFSANTRHQDTCKGKINQSNCDGTQTSKLPSHFTLFSIFFLLSSPCAMKKEAVVTNRLHGNSRPLLHLHGKTKWQRWIWFYVRKKCLP